MVKPGKTSFLISYEGKKKKGNITNHKKTENQAVIGLILIDLLLKLPASNIP